MCNSDLDDRLYSVHHSFSQSELLLTPNHHSEEEWESIGTGLGRIIFDDCRYVCDGGIAVMRPSRKSIKTNKRRKYNKLLDLVLKSLKRKKARVFLKEYSVVKGNIKRQYLLAILLSGLRGIGSS